jgi:NADPH:quinone reductase-like Zn-dependent oxidoreductase
VALDTVGSDEAVQVSLGLILDRKRFVTIAARPAAEKYGFLFIGGGVPGSAAYRSSVRARIVDLAAQGQLSVNVAQTFAFADAVAALTLLSGHHPGGKLALVP